MKLFVLVALTMVAFAANSVLNRIGVAQFGMDPFVFAVLRVAAGAAMLAGLVALRGNRPWLGLAQHGPAAFALTTYMIGFSWAYLSLGAGLGALILFGALQIMLFGWAVVQGQSISPQRWAGVALALAGLVVLLWPGAVATVPFWGTIAMLVATAGWAGYTVLGQGAQDPLRASSGNFILCLPMALPVLMVVGPTPLNTGGVLTAVVAGAVTSGLGYALWYRVLPQLATTTAATAQLSVPVIAVVGGAIFLGEPVTLRMVSAAVLVLGGIALSNARWVRAGHS